MKRLLCRYLMLLAILVLAFDHGVLAKGDTVKLAISGAWLTRPVDVTNSIALVDVWSGARRAQSWLDFPKPFIGAEASEPPASLPRFTISFYVNDGSKVSVLYKLRYVPDPATGHGYIYLPAHGDPDANLVVVRPATADGITRPKSGAL